MAKEVVTSKTSARGTVRIQMLPAVDGGDGEVVYVGAFLFFSTGAATRCRERLVPSTLMVDMQRSDKIHRDSGMSDHDAA